MGLPEDPKAKLETQKKNTTTKNSTMNFMFLITFSGVTEGEEFRLNLATC